MVQQQRKSTFLTHLSRMEFSTRINGMSPFRFKGCWVVVFIFIQFLHNIL